MQSGSQPVGTRPRLPPLRALLTFEAAARHATFSQAAEELAVTPSAVSHQIQLLEDFLGVQLFRRHAGRAVLTEAGHTFGSEIKGAFGLIAVATNLMAPQSQTGHLVIASGWRSSLGPVLSTAEILSGLSRPATLHAASRRTISAVV